MSCGMPANRLLGQIWTNYPHTDLKGECGGGGLDRGGKGGGGGKGEGGVEEEDGPHAKVIKTRTLSKY